MDRLRAVIYCRCSTEEEAQVDALKNQEAESIDVVREKNWMLIDKYVEAKSGTTVKAREEYRRLCDDLLTDKFDVIVIKSQDRLMRNVKDWYLFLDRLVTQGKKLFMYIDRKFYTPEDSLITGIKAILAEDYSRELSKKINNAHRSRQRNGGKSMLTSRTFGYKKMLDGSTEIVEEEAEIVELVYDLCISGYGSRTIANILLNKGYRNRNGNIISANRVLRMIRNPLYTGTMIMNRKHFDFDTKKEIQNPPEEWIYKKNAVPSIINEDRWRQANAAVDRRAEKLNRQSCYSAWSNPGKFKLSGKLVCADCGENYYRLFRKGYANPEETVVEWKCSTYMSKGRKSVNRRDKLRKISKEFPGGCDNVHLEEEIVFSLLESLAKDYLDITSHGKQRLIEQSIVLLQKALNNNGADGEWDRLIHEQDKINRQKSMLIDKLLAGIISDSDYQKKNLELGERLNAITMRLGQLNQSQWELQSLENRIADIKERLEHGGIEKATVGKMLEDIDCIVVHEWYLEVKFDPLKIIGITEKSPKKMELLTGKDNDDLTICIDYPFPPDTERGRFLDKIRIVETLEQTPRTTAKKIATLIDRPVRLVQNRIKELKKDGYIEYCGAGGNGTWKVLKSSEKLKAQIRK